MFSSRVSNICWKRVSVMASLISLMIIPSTQSAATIDNSTDLFLTFNQPTMYNDEPFPFHASIQAWYDTFLKVAIQRKAWPVDQYAQEEDFQPIFASLSETYPSMKPDELSEDEWAGAFLPQADILYSTAESQNAQGKSDDAIVSYMRAANVYKLAYFPWVHSATSQSASKLDAWEKDKDCFEKAIELMGHLRWSTYQIPFGEDAGADRDAHAQQRIPLRVYQSKNVTSAQAAVVIITGLDHYYTFMLDNINELTSYGFAVIVAFLPGTGDAPITGKDPQGDKLYWSAILDWIESKPSTFDSDCVSFWGISTGSYSAIRVSRFEKSRIKRALSQGTASHYTFTRQWLEAAEGLGYPFSLQTALGRSFGYYDAEDFKSNVEQYSLLQQGLLDQDGASLYAINGESDTIFPIDDQRILLEHGPGAFLRWFPHMGHNGEPLSGSWLSEFWQSKSQC